MASLQADEPSMGGLLKNILDSLQRIVRGEVRLASLEVREEIVKARHTAAVFVAGGVLLIIALGFILLGATYLLARVIGLWQAAMAVGVGVGALGAGCLAIGVTRLSRGEPLLPRTIHTLKETVHG